MKKQTNMSMSDMINFDKEVVDYINDNLQYIRENADANNINKLNAGGNPNNSLNDILASAALDHYCDSVEAFNDEENYLSDEQAERFYNVAQRLFNNGYVEHAGILYSQD